MSTLPGRNLRTPTLLLLLGNRTKNKRAAEAALLFLSSDLYLLLQNLRDT